MDKTMDGETSRFAAAFEEAVQRHGLRQSDAVRALDVSKAYVSAVATGRKAVSPRKIDEMSEALGFSEVEARRLHHAAALDAGFRLDLPDDF